MAEDNGQNEATQRRSIFPSDVVPPGRDESKAVLSAVERDQADRGAGARDQSPKSERRELFRDAVTYLVELHHVTMDMSLARNDQEMIRSAVAGARTRLGIDRLAVFLRDEDHVQGTWGTDENGMIVDEGDFRKLIHDLPDHEMVERAFREQNYVAVRKNVELHNDERIVGTGWNAMIALWYADESLGWVACDNLLHGRPLEEFQIEILKLFAASLAQALVRGRAEKELRELNRELEVRVNERTAELNAANEALELANSELRKLSRSDGLTGIANRRLFDANLKDEWARCARLREDVSVVLIDVDFFKQYNDQLGHLEGDQALREVGQSLASSVLRPADLAARYGGEEFVLLLPQTGERGAESIAERARRAIEGLQIEHPSSSVSSHLTISLGVASGMPRDEKASDIVRRADAALYEAKQGGRNRVVVASRPDSS